MPPGTNPILSASCQAAHRVQVKTLSAQVGETPGGGLIKRHNLELRARWAEVARPPTPPRSGTGSLGARRKGMGHKGLLSRDPRAKWFRELARGRRSLSGARRRLCSWWNLRYATPCATSAPPCLFPKMWHGPVSSATPGESLIPPAEQRQNRAKFLGVNQAGEWTGRPRAAPRTA